MTIDAGEMLGKKQTQLLMTELQTCTDTVEIREAAPQEAMNRSASRSNCNMP